MAQLSGTIVASRIVPSDSLDTYATHDADYGRGGYRSVADIVERDAIPDQRRKQGMLVNVINTATIYQLVGGITNSNWSVFSGFAPPSPTANVSYQCGETIGAYKVCVLTANKLYLADSSNMAHISLTKYMTIQSKSIDELCEVVEEGSVAQTGWGLSPDIPYFLGTNGNMQNAPPSVGFIQRVAVSETADRIYFDPQNSIKL